MQIITGDPLNYERDLSKYTIAGSSDPESGNTSGVNYYWYQMMDGCWYIMKQTIATGVYQYIGGVFGGAGYWAEATSLTYGPLCPN